MTISLAFLYVKALLCGLLNVMLAKVIPGLIDYLKWIGAGYMLFLAWTMIRSGWNTIDEDNSIKDASIIKTAAVLQLFNIKSWVATLSIFAVYVIPNTTSWVVICFVSLIIVAVVSVAYSVWAVLGTTLKKVFSAHKKPFCIVMGLSLIYCAVMALK